MSSEVEYLKKGILGKNIIIIFCASSDLEAQRTKGVF